MTPITFNIPDDRVDEFKALMEKFGASEKPANDEGCVRALDTSLPITERVKTFDDACLIVHGKTAGQWLSENETDCMEAHVLAYLKLCVIAKALRNGWKPVYDGQTPRYFPWFAIWTKDEQENMTEDAKKEWNAILCDFSADGYRLPTEAEWEYAAKGGSVTDTFIYSGSDSITSVAWNADSVDGETHDVGMKAPNAIGLYDMSGNVWEWCWDWYGNYHISDSDNPRGAAEEVTGRRMRRGGSIASDAVFCRNTNRASTNPEVRGVDLGFRIVRSLDSVKKDGSSSAPSEDGIIYEDDDEDVVMGK